MYGVPSFPRWVAWVLWPFGHPARLVTLAALTAVVLWAVL